MKTLQFQIPFFEEFNEKLKRIEFKLDSIQKKKSLDKRLLTTKEAAQALRISTRTLQTYRDQGEIPFIQFVREVRYRPDDIQHFLMSHYVKPKDWEGGES